MVTNLDDLKAAEEQIDKLEQGLITIIGYFQDQSDTPLVTTATVPYGADETTALSGLSKAGYAKLSDNSYVPITITWEFVETYDGTVAGEKAVTGTASGTFEGGQVPENLTGIVTVAEQEQSEDQQAAEAVEEMINALPDVDTLTIDNREDVEEAEIAYDVLTPAQKTLVVPDCVTKLENAIERMTELVLADVDERLMDAVNSLDYTDTGIEKIVYEDQTATFYIYDKTEYVYSFAFSGVMDIFDTMFTDVVAMRMNGGDTLVVDEPLMAAIQIVGVLLEVEIDFDNINEAIPILMSKTMADLVDKSIDIEITILPGDKEYIGTYVVEFVFEGETDADAEEAAESDELTTDETVDTGVIPEDETKSDDTSEIGENEVKEIIEERAVETDGVEAEGDEEFVEETDNVEETGEENQKIPVVEEDNEDVNDEAEVESSGDEDAV